ncbi:hypothetical protein ART_0508 [Arthrobacter sp. PAMC 25486]|nr:hypothetical protein ART_0508 [Arthrobacter sp. PAMC 25486]
MWGEECVAKIQQQLVGMTAPDGSSLEQTARNICAATVREGVLPATLTVGAFAFSLAILLLSLFPRESMARTRRLATVVLSSAVWAGSIWAAYLLGAWYLQFAIGAGILAALFFLIFIIIADQLAPSLNGGDAWLKGQWRARAGKGGPRT